ncbi:MAG: hypothetical protein FWF08_03555 [Oscillospiraceae bacterium]|nr:hypothetical protein [Oscillospiraceae bacterium]
MKKKLLSVILCSVMFTAVFAPVYANAADKPYVADFDPTTKSPPSFEDRIFPIKNAVAEKDDKNLAMGKFVIGYFDLFLRGLVSGILKLFPQPGWQKLSDYEAGGNFLKGSEAFADEPAAGAVWKAGYAEASVVPDDYLTKNYGTSGYLGTSYPQNVVTGVLDDQCLRLVALDAGSGIALFYSLDGLGISSEHVKMIREAILKMAEENGTDNIISVNVTCTHSHYCVDTMGIGANLNDLFSFNLKNIFKSKAPKFDSVDPEFMAGIIKTGAELAKEVLNNMTPGALAYNMIPAEDLVYDKQTPLSLDENINQLKFVPDDANESEIWLVNIAAHPTTLDRNSTLISADFPGAIVEYGKELADARVAFYQGAQAGIASNSKGIRQSIIDWEAIEESGEKVTDVMRMRAYAEEIVTRMKEFDGDSIALDPILNIRHIEYVLPVGNPILWLGAKFQLIGSSILLSDKSKRVEDAYVLSEMGYCEMGKELAIVILPGEVSPELIFGGAKPASEAFRGTEWPYPAFNAHSAVGDRHMICFGVTNDHTGYVVLDNDFTVPLASDLFSQYFGDRNKHYEELIGVSPNQASTMAKAYAFMMDGIRD